MTGSWDQVLVLVGSSAWRGQSVGWLLLQLQYEQYSVGAYYYAPSPATRTAIVRQPRPASGHRQPINRQLPRPGLFPHCSFFLSPFLLRGRALPC